MASAGFSPSSGEWLVIIPDYEGALQKRLAVRADHLADLKTDPEGFWLLGGAMLEEPIKEGETPKMNGSVMLIRGSSREAVEERLKQDVYFKGEVWDWEKVQIIPFKSAVRKAL
nr:putative Ycil-like protein [Sesquicillium sp.]